MAQLAVHARFTAHQGRGDELVAAIDEMFDTVLEESDTLVYAMHRDNDDPDVVWMYELYDSPAGLDAHGDSDAAARLGDRLEELLRREPEVGFGTPLRAKGLTVRA